MKPVVVLGRARRRAAPAPRKERRRGEDRAIREVCVSAVCGGGREGREGMRKGREEANKKLEFVALSMHPPPSHGALNLAGLAFLKRRRAPASSLPGSSRGRVCVVLGGWV
jgi:hypothetical protein